MENKIKRVPLKFKSPLYQTWEGYDIQKVKNPKFMAVTGCEDCKTKYRKCEPTAYYCIFYNKEARNCWIKEPPKGPGYQLWNNGVFGYPITPVFKTEKELINFINNDNSISLQKELI